MVLCLASKKKMWMITVRKKHYLNKKKSFFFTFGGMRECFQMEGLLKKQKYQKLEKKNGVTFFFGSFTQRHKKTQR